MSESKHFLYYIQFLHKSLEEAKRGIDLEFAKECQLVHPDEKWFGTIEPIYREVRDELEHECYYSKKDNRCLDKNKIAAILCCTLIRNKPFHFDEREAVLFLDKKAKSLVKGDQIDRSALNKWLVDNVFVNYKIAYLTALHFLYDILCRELLCKEETRKAGQILCEMKSLERYPIVRFELNDVVAANSVCEEEKEEHLDCFDTSFVIGLGRSEIVGSKINLFLLSLQFMQIEMYTRLAIKLKE